MLLKDIEFVMNNIIIDMSANVVIKRDGEFYEIAIRSRLDRDALSRSQREVGDFILKFIEICKDYDKNWKIMDEESLTVGSTKIHQVKIEL